MIPTVSANSVVATKSVTSGLKGTKSAFSKGPASKGPVKDADLVNAKASKPPALCPHCGKDGNIAPVRHAVSNAESANDNHNDDTTKTTANESNTMETIPLWWHMIVFAGLGLCIAIFVTVAINYHKLMKSGLLPAD